jgi:hypothetical protein
MILFDRRFMPPEVLYSADYETKESGAYFTNRVLTGCGICRWTISLLRNTPPQLISPISS